MDKATLKVLKPVVFLAVFVLLVGLACLTPTATEEPTVPVVQPTTSDAPTEPSVVEEDTPDAESTEDVEVEPETPGAISNLQDVKSAVVQIESQGTFDDPEIGFVANSAGRGSGFIIDPSGLAVTNNHVVTGAALLKVWVGGDTSTVYNAKIIGVSECSDLALIDIEGDGFPYVEWHEGPVNVGLEVYAAGFPLGNPEYTMTKGIVSKENADGETTWASVDSVIEHDATINPGNSGGPLLDGEGKVVGVNYASYSEANQYFAIGRDVAIPLIEELKQGKNIDTIGVNGQVVSTSDGSVYGVWVSSVASGSPADKAGVQSGDIITTLEGLYVGSDGTMSDYCDVIRTHEATDTMSIEVLRWMSQEYLEGQLNGDALVVTYAGDDIDDGEEVAAGDLMTVYDDSGAIGINVPGSWNDVQGTYWEADWGDLHFVAANVIAAPDVNAFLNTYGAPGVDFAASKDWGAIGGYVELLDGTRHWYEEDCDLDGRYDYEDPVYEGRYDWWVCGTESDLIVLAARPIENPFAYLTLVQIQLVTEDDIDAMTAILESFDVVGNLP